MITIKKTNEFNGHFASIHTLSSEADGLLFSGGVDKHLIKWNLKDINSSKVIAKTTEAIYSIYFDHYNNYLFVGTSSGKIHVIDLIEQKEIKVLKNHAGAVFYLKSHNDFLFSCGGDGVLSIIRLKDLSTIKLISLCKEKIRFMDIKNDVAALACGDASVVILDLITFKIQNRFVAHKKSCNVVRFNPNNETLLTGGWDAHLNIWDEKFELINSIPAHNYAIYSIVFSPDKNLFATGSRDRMIKIWKTDDIESPKTISQENLSGHQFSVNKLVWNEKTGLLYSASDDKKIMEWDIKMANE